MDGSAEPAPYQDHERGHGRARHAAPRSTHGATPELATGRGRDVAAALACAALETDSPARSQSRPLSAASESGSKSLRYDYIGFACILIRQSRGHRLSQLARSAASRGHRDIGHFARLAARRSTSAVGSKAIIASLPKKPPTRAMARKADPRFRRPLTAVQKLVSMRG